MKPPSFKKEAKRALETLHVHQRELRSYEAWPPNGVEVQDTAAEKVAVALRAAFERGFKAGIHAGRAGRK